MIATELRREFPATESTVVRIVTQGDVIVRHEPTESVTVEVRCSDEIDLAPVNIRSEADTVIVEVPPLLSDAPGRRGISIDLGFWSFSAGDARSDLTTLVTLPEGASLDIAARAAGDVAIAGRSGRVAIKTASGDITVGALAEGSLTAASGDITVDTAAGRLEVRTGSGDVRIGRASGTVEATSGSGDLDVGVFDGDTVTLKSGSGDLSVGLPRDVPIWQDVHSVTGDVSVTLAPAGQPDEGQRFITVRASTASGDITLRNAS